MHPFYPGIILAALHQRFGYNLLQELMVIIRCGGNGTC